MEPKYKLGQEVYMPSWLGNEMIPVKGTVVGMGCVDSPDGSKVVKYTIQVNGSIDYGNSESSLGLTAEEVKNTFEGRIVQIKLEGYQDNLEQEQNYIKSCRACMQRDRENIATAKARIKNIKASIKKLEKEEKKNGRKH